MSPYDRAAWDDLELWRTKRMTAAERHLLPRKARDALLRTRQGAKEKFDDLPGASLFSETFARLRTDCSASLVRLPMQVSDEMPLPPHTTAVAM